MTHAEFVALVDAGGVVTLPPGDVVQTTGFIRVGSNVTITTDANNPATIRNVDTSGSSVGQWMLGLMGENITIENVICDFNMQTIWNQFSVLIGFSQPGGASPPVTETIRNILIDNVTFINSGGILHPEISGAGGLDGDSWCVSLNANNNFPVNTTNSPPVIGTPLQNVMIRNCTNEGLTCQLCANGWGAPIDGLTICDNTVDRGYVNTIAVTANNILVRPGITHKNITISNNTLTNCVGAGIVVGQDSGGGINDDVKIQNIFITDNLIELEGFHQGTEEATAFQHGIFLRSTAETPGTTFGVVIARNTIDVSDGDNSGPPNYRRPRWWTLQALEEAPGTFSQFDNTLIGSPGGSGSTQVNFWTEVPRTHMTHAEFVALVDAGGVVTLPPGEVIDLETNTGVRVGSGTTITTDPDNPATIRRAPNAVTCLFPQGEDITISNVIMDLDFNGVWREFTSCIRFNQPGFAPDDPMRNITIDNVTFIDSTPPSDAAGRPGGDCWMIDCTTNNHVGNVNPLHLPVRDVLITRCRQTQRWVQLTGNGWGPYGWDGLQITHNYITQGRVTAISLSSRDFENVLKNVTISFNNIDQTTGSGIFVGQDASGTDYNVHLENILIADNNINLFRDPYFFPPPTENDPHYGHCIFLRASGSGKNINIVRNVFDMQGLPPSCPDPDDPVQFPCSEPSCVTIQGAPESPAEVAFFENTTINGFCSYILNNVNQVPYIPPDPIPDDNFALIVDNFTWVDRVGLQAFPWDVPDQINLQMHVHGGHWVDQVYTAVNVGAPPATYVREFQYSCFSHLVFSGELSFPFQEGFTRTHIAQSRFTGLGTTAIDTRMELVTADSNLYNHVDNCAFDGGNADVSVYVYSNQFLTNPIFEAQSGTVAIEVGGDNVQTTIWGGVFEDCGDATCVVRVTKGRLTCIGTRLGLCKLPAVYFDLGADASVELVLVDCSFLESEGFDKGPIYPPALSNDPSKVTRIRRGEELVL